MVLYDELNYIDTNDAVVIRDFMDKLNIDVVCDKNYYCHTKSGLVLAKKEVVIDELFKSIIETDLKEDILSLADDGLKQLVERIDGFLDCCACLSEQSTLPFWELDDYMIFVDGYDGYGDFYDSLKFSLNQIDDLSQAPPNVLGTHIFMTTINAFYCIHRH